MTLKKDLWDVSEVEKYIKKYSEASYFKKKNNYKKVTNRFNFIALKMRKLHLF